MNKNNEWSEYWFQKIRKKGCAKRISENINITEETIKNNMEYNWYLPSLALNSNLSINFLLKHQKKNIEINELELKRFYYNILKNVNYTFEYFSEIPNEYDITSYSLNKNIDFNNKNIKIDYSNLSFNPNISYEYVIEHEDQCWSYETLAKNNIIKLEHIIKNKKLNKKNIEFFENPNFDIDEYKKHFEIKEIPYNIHYNPKLSIELINKISIEYPTFIWDYAELSKNKIFEFNYIIKNNKGWDIDNLSLNPNISWEIIENNDFKWNYKKISENTFEKERIMFLHLSIQGW